VKYVFKKKETHFRFVIHECISFDFVLEMQEITVKWVPFYLKFYF